MALSMIFHLRREHRGVAVLRGPRRARRSARCVVTFLLQALRRRDDGAHRGGAAARRRGRASRAASAPRGGGRSRSCSSAWRSTNERTELFRVVAGRAQGHAPAHDGARPARTSRRPAGTRTRASTRSRAFESPYLARLYIDSDAWTNMLQWDGNLESVRDLSTWYRALPFKLVQAAEDAHHRPGRRIGRARRARVGQQEGHGRRAQPADAAVRAPLRRRARAISTTGPTSR